MGLTKKTVQTRVKASLDLGLLFSAFSVHLRRRGSRLFRGGRSKDAFISQATSYLQNANPKLTKTVKAAEVLGPRWVRLT
jgi:hypothetical protein